MSVQVCFHTVVKLFRDGFSQNVQNKGDLSFFEGLVLLLLLMRLSLLFLRLLRLLLLVLLLMLLCCCCSSCCCCCCCWHPAAVAAAVAPGVERLKSQDEPKKAFQAPELVYLACFWLLWAALCMLFVALVWAFLALSKPLQAILGTFRGHIRLSGPFLGPSRGYLAAIMGPLGGILTVLGPSWSPPGAT